MNIRSLGPGAVAAAAIAQLTLGAQAAYGQAENERGAELVATHCLTCHKVEPMRKFVERCSAAGKGAHLDGLLKDHFSVKLEDDARADVIAFLTCEPDPKSKG